MPPDIEIIKKLVKSVNPGWPAPIKYIGGGANGRIFETTNGRYLKIVANNASRQWNSLHRLQGSFIVPRFKANNRAIANILPTQRRDISQILQINVRHVGKHLSLFIMEKVGGPHSMTLANYIKKYPNTNTRRIQDRILYIIEHMHMKGISHGNLHAGNIIVRVDSAGRITGMWVIDFGRSNFIPFGKTEREHYKVLGPIGKFPTGSLTGRNVRNVPLFEGIRRANVHMSNVHYGRRYIAPRENIIRNRRLAVATEMRNYRSPTRSTSVRRSKSASPVKNRRPKSNNGKASSVNRSRQR